LFKFLQLVKGNGRDGQLQNNTKIYSIFKYYIIKDIFFQ
jgi:hypothetical protein